MKLRIVIMDLTCGHDKKLRTMPKMLTKVVKGSTTENIVRQ